MSAKRRIRRKPEDAEREILDAAEALLKEIRFRDLTVDAVAAAANMRDSGSKMRTPIASPQCGKGCAMSSGSGAGTPTCWRR